jgi:hypothetical protein
MSDARMPKQHPRVPEFNRANRNIQVQLSELQRLHGLTDVEMLAVLQDRVNEIVGWLVREERGPVPRR